MTLTDEQEPPKYDYKASEEKETTCQKATSSTFVGFQLNGKKLIRIGFFRPRSSTVFRHPIAQVRQFELNCEYAYFAILSKTEKYPNSYTNEVHLMGFCCVYEPRINMSNNVRNNDHDVDKTRLNHPPNHQK